MTSSNDLRAKAPREPIHPWLLEQVRRDTDLAHKWLASQVKQA